MKDSTILTDAIAQIFVLAMIGRDQFNDPKGKVPFLITAVITAVLVAPLFLSQVGVVTNDFVTDRHLVEISLALNPGVIFYGQQFVRKLIRKS